jgi:nucleoside-diphosphate-sugar epimerase
MKVFITGGTGFLGNRLTERLVAGNHEIVLLVRDPGRANYFRDAKVTVIKGDLFDKPALKLGMNGCDLIFHMAALTKPWSKDPLLPYRTNVEGTINVMDTAVECNVAKVVITSTGGTMSFSQNGKIVNESVDTDIEYNTLYESTKAAAEKIAFRYCEKGLNVTIVNPTRIYGPGMLSVSNSLTKIIRWYTLGLWRFMPGDGKSIGNYVYVDDVIDGHILAAKAGRSGERYILGGENISFRELFRIIGKTCGRNRHIFYLPVSLMKMVIKLNSFLSNITGRPPMITTEWLDKYMKNWIMSSEKAEKELGYKITPVTDGVRKTIEWLRIKKKRNGKH